MIAEFTSLAGRLCLAFCVVYGTQQYGIVSLSAIPMIEELGVSREEYDELLFILSIGVIFVVFVIMTIISEKLHYVLATAGTITGLMIIAYLIQQQRYGFNSSWTEQVHSALGTSLLAFWAIWFVFKDVGK